MEQVKPIGSYNIEALTAQLKSGDNSGIEDFKKYLDQKYPISPKDRYARLAAVYEEAGRLVEAKDNYYSAKRHAEEAGDHIQAAMLMDKVRSLPGEIE
jgi:hypothetical protein